MASEYQEDYVAVIINVGEYANEEIEDTGGCKEEGEEQGSVENGKVAAAEGSFRVCRVCHLGSPDVRGELGELIELTCTCKDDLALAHRKCAEAWFKIRGTRKCEICKGMVGNINVKISVWRRITNNVDIIWFTLLILVAFGTFFLAILTHQDKQNL